MRGSDRRASASTVIGDKDIVVDAPRAQGGFGLPTGEEVVRAVIRHWPIVAIAALAAMLLGWLFSAVQPKRYRATAVGAVAPAVDRLETTDVLRGVDSLERRTVVSTVAALASMPIVTGKVIPSSLRGYSVSASVVPMTNLFNVNVEGGDPKQVAAIANRVPDALAGPATSMYKLYRVTLVSPANVPGAPFLPRTGRAAIAGLLLGTVAGVAFAWLLDRRRSRIRT
jgi:capsular polysaccharide biosynthesis protein